MGPFEHDPCLLSKRATVGWIFGIDPRWAESEWGAVHLVLESPGGEYCIIYDLFPTMASLRS